MLEKYGFTAIDAKECYERYGWGIDLVEGSKVYRREDGAAVTWVGCMDDEWVCEVEVEGLCGQWTGYNPIDALINGYIDHLHEVAVMKEWKEPYLLGLKYCCEDVVDWLAYNVTNAITEGLTSIAYSDCTMTTNVELFNHVKGNAIETARYRGEDWGIEFVDVWED